MAIIVNDDESLCISVYVFLRIFLETVNFLCVKMGPEWAGGFRPIGTIRLFVG